MDDARPRGPDGPLTPDFASYAPGPAIASVEPTTAGLCVRWRDGASATFNRFWLRENEVADGVINPVTRERDLETDMLPETLRVTGARQDASGAVVLTWAPDGVETRHHPGWLHDAATGGWHPSAALPARRTWRADDLPAPVTFDGPAVLASDAALQDWLRALWTWGFARLEALPADYDTVLEVARRIGTVRASNFGYTFRVETKPNPDSNAYTSQGLPAHTDLASREVQPGLQLLHCLQNECTGGASTMVDGFAVAEAVHECDSDLFDALTGLNWVWSNRHAESDYRWSGPIVEMKNGEIDEIRYTSFLRSYPDMDETEVERAYRALRLYARLAKDDAFVCRTPFRPGDLVIFDNRRILHGRDPFEAGGARRLEGCYMERDELFSRLRVLRRDAT